MAQTGIRREQIYATAGNLFSRNGYHATSVRDIARELNLQGGSLYAHIDSKEDVLWEIVQRAAAEFLESVPPLAHTPGTAGERLRLMIRAHVHVVTHHLEDATVFFHEWRFLSADRRAVVARERDEYEAAFRAVIEQGIDAGEFRRADARLATFTVLASVNWLYQWYSPDGEYSPDEVADGIADLLLEGLMAGGNHD